MLNYENIERNVKKGNSMQNSLTDEGYSNLLEIFDEYALIKATKKFIDQNYEALSAGFPLADDPAYQKGFSETPKNEEWWTFENEVNGGGIFDSSPRDLLLSNFAKLLTGQDWPIYADGRDVMDNFLEEFRKSVYRHPELEMLANSP